MALLIVSASPSRALPTGVAHDVDADGIADTLELLPVLDPSATEPGVARVRSGATGDAIHTFLADSLADYFAFAGDFVGDVDADGVDDIAITAVRDAASTNRRGRIYVFSGSTGALLAELIGDTDEYFGARVGPAGDLDADGHADIAAYGLASRFDGDLITPRRTVISGRTFHPLIRRDMHERAVLMTMDSPRNARADMNADRLVTTEDMPGLLLRMGGPPEADGRGDLDADGLVTDSDLVLFISELEGESMTDEDPFDPTVGMVSAMLGGPGFDCITDECCDLNPDVYCPPGGGDGGTSGGGGGGSACSGESVVIADNPASAQAVYDATYQLTAIAALAGGQFAWEITEGASHVSQSQVTGGTTTTSHYSFSTAGFSGQADGLISIQVTYTNGSCTSTSTVTIPIARAFLNVSVDGLEFNADTSNEALPYGETAIVTAAVDPPGGQFEWTVLQSPTRLGSPPDAVIVEFDEPTDTDTELTLHARAMPGDVFVEVTYTSLDGVSINAIVAAPVELFQLHDGDIDGLGDLREEQLGTDPLNADTDGDELFDGCEDNFNWDPLDAGSPDASVAIVDTDNDGLTDVNETCLGTSPTDWDSDDDGLSDGYEHEHNDNVLNPLDPNRKDTNGDGIPDGQEDPDDDGLTNAEEQIYGTNPSDDDTDGDGTKDGDEVDQGSFPNDPTDNGQTPPEQEVVEIELSIGDLSPSESETWTINVGDHISLNSIGGEVRTEVFPIRRGRVYPIFIHWIGSTLSSPDFDWQSNVRAAPGEDAPVVVDDPDGIITGGAIVYGHNVNQVAGKVAYLYAPSLDIDIDSDNSSLYASADRSDAEELIEDGTGIKVLIVNRDDRDLDEIPGYADGFAAFGPDSTSTDPRDRFIPIALDMFGLDGLGGASVTFSYDASDPALATDEVVPVPDVESEFHRYSAAPGTLRLWRSDAASQRTLADFIPTDTELTVADFGGSATIFVEAVAGSSTPVPISVTVTLPDGVTLTDQVKVLPFDSETGLSISAIDGFTILYGVSAGTEGNDIIFGTPSNDTIDAGSGDDIIVSGMGDDIIIAGSGDDVAYAWTGHNDINMSVDFSSGVARGGAEDDRIITERLGAFTTEQVLLVYRLMYGENDPWLEIFFNELNGVVASVHGDGVLFSESDWDHDIVFSPEGERQSRFTIQVEFDLGGPILAASKMREELLNIAASSTGGASNVFQSAMIGEAFDRALLQDDFDDVIADYVELRQRAIVNAAETTRLIAAVYLSSPGIFSVGADFVITVGEFTNGDLSPLEAGISLAPFAIAAAFEVGKRAIIRTIDEKKVLERGGELVGLDRRALRAPDSGRRGVGLIPRSDFAHAKIFEVRETNGRVSLLVGTPQVTSGDHAEIVDLLARARIDDGTVDYVVINRSLKTATGRSDLGGVSGWQPDITVVRRDGRVDLYEVQSQSNNLEDLIEKVKLMNTALPPENRGSVFVLSANGSVHYESIVPFVSP